MVKGETMNIKNEVRKLTEKQQKFLDVLFEEAKGDTTKAKNLAGYAKNVTATQVVSSLEAEVATLTRKFISQSSTKAVYSMFEALDPKTNPLGLKERMTAAKDFLDRAGFKPTEKVEVTTVDPVFILPAKRPKED